jgi:hypothetical protein
MSAVMSEYERELQSFRPDDEMQGLEKTEQTKGYYFIPTAAHGYLVVPVSDKYAVLAKKICSYGYKGRLAYYLEEDCEAGDFLKLIGGAA